MSTSTISFFVSGVPCPKQSFRVAGHGRGFTPARVKDWQQEVGWAAQRKMRALGMDQPLSGNLIVHLCFFLKDRRRQDLDNLSKSVQDGLNGIVWYDDHQNVRLILDKYVCRARQGVHVHVIPTARAFEIDREIVDAIAGEGMNQ